MGDVFLTYQQAAERAGISYATVVRLVQRGALPVYTDGYRMRPKLIKLADLDALGRTGAQPALLQPQATE